MLNAFQITELVNIHHYMVEASKTGNWPGYFMPFDKALEKYAEYQKLGGLAIHNEHFIPGIHKAMDMKKTGNLTPFRNKAT